MRQDIKDGGTVSGGVCILVPTAPNSGMFHVLCGDSLLKLAKTIKTQLGDTFTFPTTDEAFKGMLFSTTETPHIDDGDEKFYFNFPANGNHTLLVALQRIATQINGWVTESGSLPNFGTIVDKLWAFLQQYGAHISLLILVAGIVAMLLSSDDDPKSFIPKNTQKWLSTTSTAKKVVDVGSYWHRHFGDGYRPDRPGWPNEQRPAWSTENNNRPSWPANDFRPGFRPEPAGWPHEQRPDQPSAWQKFQDRVPQMLRPNNFANAFNKADDGFESLQF